MTTPSSTASSAPPAARTIGVAGPRPSPRRSASGSSVGRSERTLARTHSGRVSSSGSGSGAGAWSPAYAATSSSLSAATSPRRGRGVPRSGSAASIPATRSVKVQSIICPHHGGPAIPAISIEHASNLRAAPAGTPSARRITVEGDGRSPAVSERGPGWPAEPSAQGRGRVDRSARVAAERAATTGECATRSRGAPSGSSKPGNATWPPASRTISWPAAASTARVRLMREHPVQARSRHLAQGDGDRAEGANARRVLRQQVGHLGDPARVGRLEPDDLQLARPVAPLPEAGIERRRRRASPPRPAAPPTPRPARSRRRSRMRRRPSSARRRRRSISRGAEGRAWRSATRRSGPRPPPPPGRRNRPRRAPRTPRETGTRRHAARPAERRLRPRRRCR